MGRIEELCALTDPCKSFADVGCDHGYIAKHVLDSGKCKNVLITDVSAKSLSKAERLLARYIESGECRSVCCDGLALVPPETEQVVIAGMGGEEIIKIFVQGYVPLNFVLQPMKNAEKVRKFLIDSGCKITVDDIFQDDKYYFVIKGERQGGTENYSPLQLAFGRDSLKNPILKTYAAEELDKRKNYLSSCTTQ
ncbi:MAG: class I SAM-dependent methyltransferase, partial [Clostridia bacterium]|nr:class I SAM-dependent methyltransferase [Clostridia bacterium]